MTGFLNRRPREYWDRHVMPVNFSDLPQLYWDRLNGNSYQRELRTRGLLDLAPPDFYTEWQQKRQPQADEFDDGWTIWYYIVRQQIRYKQLIENRRLVREAPARRRRETTARRLERMSPGLKVDDNTAPEAESSKVDLRAEEPDKTHGRYARFRGDSRPWHQSAEHIIATNDLNFDDLTKLYEEERGWYER